MITTEDLLSVARDTRQKVIKGWMTRCFGVDVVTNLEERGKRVLEESIELAQAAGVSKADALRLLDWVYSKPAGEIDQEVGGVGVTLLGFGPAIGTSVDVLECREIARILNRPVDAWKKRHAEKAALGVAMAPEAEPA